MTDFRVLNRPALSDNPPRVFGDIKISAIAEGHILHVLGKPGEGDLSPMLAGLPGAASLAIRTVGPGQWYLVGDAPLSQDEVKSVLAALSPRAAGVDQSHGRVRIRVEGPMVERMLAKGTAVDLDITAFPIGRSATTLIGHIGCHMTRLESDVFELMVLRGFAENLWDDLVQMSVEYA